MQPYNDADFVQNMANQITGKYDVFFLVVFVVLMVIVISVGVYNYRKHGQLVHPYSVYGAGESARKNKQRIDKLEKQITHLNREIKRLKKDNGAQD